MLEIIDQIESSDMSIYILRFSSFLAIVAAAPSDKKVFSDGLLNELRSEIFGKAPANDPHLPCISFFNCSICYISFLLWY